ncbi:MAG: signal peptidase I [Phycisphaerae bacterium]
MPAPRAAKHGHFGAIQVVETIQTVLTALILAFVFRAFFIEAFIIPTGSMAESLRGEHGHFVCPRCGWSFDYGPDRASPAGDEFVLPREVLCPNCHEPYVLDPRQHLTLAGDRVLVHKWPFELGDWLGPRRWDVIVFRDPADPEQNFIKRLIGLPGEALEIVDGDVYVNGIIQRKTAAAQQALWSVVHDQDHVVSSSSRPVWAVVSGDAAAWSGLDSRVPRFAGGPARRSAIRFNPNKEALYSEDLYGYNQSASGAIVRDLRIAADLVPAGDSEIGFVLDRGDERFLARVAASGSCDLIGERLNGDTRQEHFRETNAFTPTAWIRVELRHVDYRAALFINGVELLHTDDAYAPNLDALRHAGPPTPAVVEIEGRGGNWELHNVRIYRDVYYTYRPGATLRATPGDAFRLQADEYFVLGDNSPFSHDGREWYRVGPHLTAAYHGQSYRPGTVRRDQVVGRAFFVYLPALQPSDAVSFLRVPDFGRTRVIR